MSRMDKNILVEAIKADPLWSIIYNSLIMGTPITLGEELDHTKRFLVKKAQRLS